MKFLVHFKGRQLEAYDTAEWAKFSDRQGEEPFFITAEEGKRSLLQNDYIQGLARLLSEYTGHTMKYFRDAAVLNVLGLEDGLEKEAIVVLDVTIRPVKSTADLNKADGSKVIEWLKELCHSMDLRIPKRLGGDE